MNARIRHYAALPYFKRIHSRSPLWFERAYTPVVYFFRHLQGFYLRSYLIEGRESRSGKLLTIAYFGRDLRIRHYWTCMLFREVTSIRKERAIPLWKIPSRLRSTGERQDLAITEMNHLSGLFYRPQEGFLLPRWFDTLLDPQRSLEALRKYKIQKFIAKYRFSYQVRTEDEDLLFFYERMYKPFIQARHKEASVIMDYSYFQKRFRRKDSRLYFLMMDGKPAAATFTEKREGRMKFSGIGVLDGSREILNRNAIRALYHFIFSEYQEDENQPIDFGGTSPLLSDGLTRFKIQLRAFPNHEHLPGEKSLWIQPLGDSEPLRCLLKANPFLHHCRKRLYRALFVDAEDLNGPQELLELLNRTRIREIEGTTVYCMKGGEQISEWISRLGLDTVIKVLSYPPQNECR